MNQPPSRPRRLYVLLACAGSLVLVLLAVAGATAYRDLVAARDREAVLSDGIVSTRERVAQLEAQVDRLTSDPSTLELLARRELGLVQEDDLVVVFAPEPPSSPASSPPGDG